jgi:acyl dehydratase
MDFLTFDDISEGLEKTVTMDSPVSRIHLARYAGASGDFNPIHLVPEYAKNAGMKDNIVHGMFMDALVGKLISNFFGIRPVRKFSVTFKNVAYIGDVLTARFVVNKKYVENMEKYIELKVSVFNQDHIINIDGKAILQLI